MNNGPYLRTRIRSMSAEIFMMPFRRERSQISQNRRSRRLSIVINFFPVNVSPGKKGWTIMPAKSIDSKKKSRSWIPSGNGSKSSILLRIPVWIRRSIMPKTGSNIWKPILKTDDAVFRTTCLKMPSVPLLSAVKTGFSLTL